MNPAHIQIWRTRSELEQYAAKHILELISNALEKNRRYCLAVSGGETPKNVYQLLGKDEAARRIAWDRVHLFFCDERMVPPDDQKSNYGMVYREWLSHVSIPQENIHRMRGEIDPSLAAREYEEELRKTFYGDRVVFDLVLLGVGEDGHTASLFPGTDVVQEQKELVRSIFVPPLNSWRLSLTLPVINAAKEIVFLAAGIRKSYVVAHVLTQKDPKPELPASLVRQKDGNLFWLIDEEAAGKLKDESHLDIQRMS